MNRDAIQFFGFLGMGIICWFGGYVAHKNQAQPRSALLKLPRWIVLLCGNPRKDWSFDLGDGGIQLIGLCLVAAGIFSVSFGIDFQIRVRVFYFVLFGGIAIWCAAMLVAKWLKTDRRNQD